MDVKQVTEKWELEKAFDIRKTVFVEEQGVPLEDEFDENESLADHILVYHDDEPVGTGRVRIVDGVAKLERICVLSSHRKYGLGKTIVRALEDMAMKKGLIQAKLHGQFQAQSFYEKLGYHKASDIFMEDGIPHLLMLKNLD